MQIFVDSDACPVKDEVVRVAERHGLAMSFVSNSWMRGPDHVLAERITMAAGPDAADDWIAERAAAGDIVITNDIPLAHRCVAAERLGRDLPRRSENRERDREVEA